MKVLITGGAGFIGSHIADLFVRSGLQVHILDNLSLGKIENVNPQAQFHQVDILDAEPLNALCEKEKFDVICHQAALVNVRESLQKPLLYSQVNVIGSLNLLEIVREQRVKKFIFASSGGAVYGEPTHLPVEEDHPTQPLDIYGANKSHVEYYISLYQKYFGVTYTILRYANVFGPRQNPHGENGVVSIFAKAMLQRDSGAPVIINGTGEQMRDFVYVEDVARANLLALERGDNATFNVGSGKGASIQKICDDLTHLTGFEGPITHVSAKLGEVNQIWLDCRKAQVHLGWTPQIDLEAGLARTVQFLNQRSLQA